MNGEIEEKLARIRSEDVAIDPFGRVVLSDPRLAAGIGKDIGALASNYGCCTNGALCKKELLTDIIQEIDAAKR